MQISQKIGASNTDPVKYIRGSEAYLNLAGIGWG
jgi:hypothetical protein